MARPEDTGLQPDRPQPSLELLAGHLYFGARVHRVRTLLGSCVGITLWHPRRRLGGLCHFLLPGRRRLPGMGRDGRFGDEALEILVDLIRESGTHPRDYQAHLYGGADTLSDLTGVTMNIGERNIERGWALIDHYGFQLANVDVGERCPRTVSLRLEDGHVEMRRGPTEAPPNAWQRRRAA